MLSSTGDILLPCDKKNVKGSFSGVQLSVDSYLLLSSDFHCVETMS